MKTHLPPRTTCLALALAMLVLPACKRSGEDEFFRVENEAPPEAVTDVDPPRSGHRVAARPPADAVATTGSVLADDGHDAPGRDAAERYMAGQDGGSKPSRTGVEAAPPRPVPASAPAPAVARVAPPAASSAAAAAREPAPPVDEPRAMPRAASPGDARALNQRAITLINAARPDEAIPLLERALAMQPRDAEILGNLGYAHMLAGDHGKARARLLGSLELAPTRSATWLNLGQTYAEMGQRDVAVDAVLKGYRYSTRKPSVRSALQRAATGTRYDPGWREAAGLALRRIGADARS